MTTRTIPHSRTALGALIVALSLAAMLVLPIRAHASLSSSAYRVGALCSAPAPGYASCLGLRLVAKHPHALRGVRASRPAISSAAEQIEYSEPWPGSLSPQDVLRAYSLSSPPAPLARQTLALVDAYNDPSAEEDLAVFDAQYNLPACTELNGCFTKEELRGGHNNSLPATEPGWAQEIATDVEVAHSVCQSCKILLVEAHSNSNADLEAAEERAVALGADEISNSWGGPEQGITTAEDENDAFNHPGIVITASAGDDGYLDWGLEKASERGFADYPASSPHVLAVGGTRLSRTASGAWKEETVWNGKGAGGSGCSTVLTAPPWQQSVTGWSAVGCGTHRAVADVAADADPYTGVAIYDSTPIREGEVEYSGWVPIGGTSVSSPIIAATFALAGGAGTGPHGEAIAYPAQTLYDNFATDPAALHDVTLGSNGKCAKSFNEATGTSGCTPAEEEASCADAAICGARQGYDGPTGVGTPHGIAAFESAGETARIKQLEEQATAEEKRAAEERRAAEELAERKAAEERAAEHKAEEEARERAIREQERKAEEERKTEEERQRLTEAAKAKEIAEAEERARRERIAELERQAAATTAQSSPLATLPGPASPSPSLSLTPTVSALALTRAATTALSHGRPHIARVAFVFALNVPARVHVTLAKQVALRGRHHWQTLPDSLTLAGTQGRNSARLSAPGVLRAGRYQLTLKPVGGSARSLTFSVS